MNEEKKIHPKFENFLEKLQKYVRIFFIVRLITLFRIKILDIIADFIVYPLIFGISLYLMYKMYKTNDFDAYKEEIKKVILLWCLVIVLIVIKYIFLKR